MIVENFVDIPINFDRADRAVGVLPQVAPTADL